MAIMVLHYITLQSFLYEPDNRGPIASPLEAMAMLVADVDSVCPAIYHHRQQQQLLLLRPCTEPKTGRSGISLEDLDCMGDR